LLAAGKDWKLVKSINFAKSRYDVFVRCESSDGEQNPRINRSGRLGVELGVGDGAPEPGGGYYSVRVEYWAGASACMASVCWLGCPRRLAVAEPCKRQCTERRR